MNVYASRDQAFVFWYTKSGHQNSEEKGYLIPERANEGKRKITVSSLTISTM